jgi:arylsulfatase A-like enzyme
MGLNIDFAPTFLDVAGLNMPAQMQGRSLLPILQSRHPKGWRTAMYYRSYYQGTHNTAPQYGIRTTTHKLIHFWKKDQWELYDLRRDPHEMHNLYGRSGTQKLTADLKKRLSRLKREVKDNDEFATQLPKEDVDSPIPTLRGL